MRNLRLIVLCLAAATLVSACGTSRSALRDKAADHFARGEFTAAEKEILSPEVISESNNRLLTLLELGAIAHYQEQFEKSNEYLYKAKLLARRLYTTSIRKTIASGLINDNASDYTGMDYEISMLHYFMALNFLFLSQSDVIPSWSMLELRDGDTVVFPAKTVSERSLSNKDKVDFLGKARAELLDWNAYLQQVRNDNRGKPFYKDDLLNKVFAAYVHREVGSSRDNNIASVLYNDAEDVLVKAYSAYPTFNSQYQDFVENYPRFSRLGVNTVRTQFMQTTPFFDQTMALIREGEKNLQTPSRNTIQYIVEFGMIPKRTEKRYVIGLSTIMNEVKDPALRRSLEELSAHLILQLAPEFGLTVVGAAVVGGAVGSRDGQPQYLSQAVDSVLGFEFYLPHIEPSPTNTSIQLKFVSKKDGSETTIPVGILSPLNDIAELNVERRAAAVATKTGIRVGLKYLAALVPAIYTYQRIDGGKFLKILAASTVWAAGKKIVDSSEQADIRAWNLLPKWIGSVEASLSPGEYNVIALAQTSGQSKEIPLSSIVVAANEKHKVFKSRILSTDNLESSPTVNIIK